MCPASFYDGLLSTSIFSAIEIEDFGGLHKYTGHAIALLPWRLVDFYQTVLNTRDRLLAERDHAQAKLYQ